jgi:hypothetical protein
MTLALVTIVAMCLPVILGIGYGAIKSNDRNKFIGMLKKSEELRRWKQLKPSTKEKLHKTSEYR